MAWKLKKHYNYGTDYTDYNGSIDIKNTNIEQILVFFCEVKINIKYHHNLTRKIKNGIIK